MKTIRYSLHFASLAVAAVIFWLAQDLSLPYWISSFNFFPFALMGALHATCVVVSLRDRRATRSISFITLAAIWSAVTPIAGLWGSIVWFPFDDFLNRYGLGAYMIFLTGSAIGASGYWLLVRLFWLKSLRRADWFRTVSLCVTASLLSVLVGGTLDRYVLRVTKQNAEIPILTVAWWFAFSTALYWSETRGQANKSTEAMGAAS